MNHMDTSARNIYRILTIITSFILILVVAFLVRRQLIWIGTAFFLAISLNPGVDYLARKVTRNKRGWAIGLTFLILIGGLVLLLASLVPPLVRQSGDLVRNLPEYTDKVVNADNIVGQLLRRYDLVNRVKSDQAQLIHQASQFGGSFFIVIRGIFSSLAATITVLGLTFFMLLEGPGWIDTVWRRYPDRRKQHHKQLVIEMYEAVTGFVAGNFLTSLIAGIASAIMLLILGVPYVAPMAIFVAIMDLVPLVGATIGAIVVTLVALFHSTTAAIVMLAFFIVYQQIENHALQPIVYGKTVRISPLLVLISVLVGAGLGGLLGALVAIPVAASLQILAKDYVERHLAKSAK